jgi:hypothetical protein
MTRIIDVKIAQLKGRQVETREHQEGGLTHLMYADDKQPVHFWSTDLNHAMQLLEKDQPFELYFDPQKGWCAYYGHLLCTSMWCSTPARAICTAWIEYKEIGS